MTPAEVILWARLRAHRLEGIHFRNHTCLICLANHGRCQGHAVGNYIPDFCSPKARLILELDGSQHLEQNATQYDTERTKYLELRGYKVLRFWNNDVMNDIESVIRAIIQAMESEAHL